MMTALSVLSLREKRIFSVVAGMLVIFLIDLAFRAWGAGLASIEREEKQLKVLWDYSSGLLARSPGIEEKYSTLRSRFPKFFEDDHDPTRAMAELDGLAKTAGVQVNMIRPQPSYERAERDGGGVPAPVRPAGTISRIEIALRGSWPQVMRFFQTVEDRDHLFQFSTVSVHRQERTGELEISATLQK
jgi:hypothetical protein